jgi:WD40 repeat protein
LLLLLCDLCPCDEVNAMRLCHHGYVRRSLVGRTIVVLAIVATAGSVLAVVTPSLGSEPQMRTPLLMPDVVLRRRIIRPGSNVECLAYDARRELVITGTNHGCIDWWDPRSFEHKGRWHFKLEDRIIGPTIYSLAISDDANWMAAATSEGVHVFDLQSRQVVWCSPGSTLADAAVIMPGTMQVAYIEWHEDKQIAYLASFDQANTKPVPILTGWLHGKLWAVDRNRVLVQRSSSLALVDTSSRQVVRTLEVPYKASVLYDQRRRWALAETRLPGAEAATLCGWEVDSGELVLNSRLEKGNLIAELLAILGPDRVAAILRKRPLIGGDIGIFDPQSGKCLVRIETAQAPGGHPTANGALLASPDAKVLYLAGDGVVRAFDAVSGTELTVGSGHAEAIHRVCFSPDSTQLLSATPSGGSTILWSLQDGRPTIRHTTGYQGNAIDDIAFTRRGEEFLVVGTCGTSVYASANGELKRRHPWPDYEDDAGERKAPRSCESAFPFNEGDGIVFITGDSKRTAVYWDVARWCEVGRYELPKSDPSVVLPTGMPPRPMALHYFDKMYVFDPQGRTVLAEIATEALCRRARLYEEGRYVLVIGHEAVRLCDLRSFQTVSVAKMKATDVFDSVLLPEHRHVVMIGRRRFEAEVHDLQSGELIATLGGFMGGPACLAVSPNGEWLAIGGEDSQIGLWKLSRISDVVAK